MIHCSDLLASLIRVSASRRGASGHLPYDATEAFPEPPLGMPDTATSTSPPVPFYVAATDGNKITLEKILKKIGGSFLHFSSMESAVEAMMIGPEGVKWNMDISLAEDPAVQLSFREGLCKRFKDIWAEFLVEQNLLPVSYVITGPPCSGKTSVSQALAKRFVTPACMIDIYPYSHDQ